MNLRHADVRPWSVDVNFEVANQLLREGNVDGARRYGAHAASAVSAGASTADPDLAASVRLFHAYVAWVQDDPDQTLRALNEVAASAGKLTDGDRRQLYLRLSPMYAALGRLREAERAIEKIGPAARDDVVNATMVDIARAELFADRGDLIGLRELAGTQWHDPLPTNAPPRLAFRVPFLIEARLLDAAERDLEWFTRRTADASEWAPRAPTASIGPFYAANAGSLELARGRPAAAAVILRQAMPGGRSGPPAMFSPGGPQGQYAAMRLAAALEAVGNIPEAIATLEQAVADRVAVTIGNTPNRWLRTNAYLARLHRRNKQEAKARTIEAQLLKLLSEADADHPLVVELGRRGSETREHQGSWAGHARARQ